MNVKILLLLGVVLTFGSVAVAQNSSNPAPAKRPVAIVAGQPIYEEELAPLTAGEMQQLRNKEYEIKSQALDDLINRKVVLAEATKQGITAVKLIEQEVDSKVPEPTEAEIQAFYKEHKDQVNRPLEEIKTQVHDALKKATLQQARQEYFQRLRQESKVSILLRPPVLDIGYDPARVRGDPKAPVTIVEFSDFQCPFCLRAYPTMKEMMVKYAGRIKWAYRDFPLRDGHPLAQTAAEAARCANEQGKFWEYHDLLFSNPDKLDLKGLTEEARVLKLDQKSFESCLASGKFKPDIEADLQAGIKAGITGTPAFFINGVLVSGAQPPSVFEKAIDAELAKIEPQIATHRQD